MKNLTKGFIMIQHEILAKIGNFKNNLQNILGKKAPRFFKTDNSSANVDDEEEMGLDNYLDDLPLTINRDPGPGIKYYLTENSEFARGAEREVPRGIDSFGEEDTFEADKR